jgi:hypothetical protein
LLNPFPPLMIAFLQVTSRISASRDTQEFKELNLSDSTSRTGGASQDLAFPSYLHSAAETTKSFGKSSARNPSDFGSSLHTYQSAAPLDPPPPLQTPHRDFASTVFLSTSASSAPVTFSALTNNESRNELRESHERPAAHSGHAPIARAQPALSRFVGTPQRTFLLPSHAPPPSLPVPANTTSRSIPHATHSSFFDESLSSVNNSHNASSSQSTPSSSAKSYSQAPLAPHVTPHVNRQSSSDSAAARFVSSLSEAHLQSMLSDLVVEKNALVKVSLYAYHV